MTLSIYIADDHGRSPMWNKFETEITIPEPPEIILFDAESLLRERDQKKKEENLPPPFMKIGKLDEQNRVLISFERAVRVNWFPGRRLQSSELAIPSLSSLDGITNQNGGDELFKVKYEPSNRSEKY